MKREFHYFTLTDYEKEEVYLREMHQKGWKFHHVTVPGVYYFEACTPEDVVYRLDFNPDRKENMADYIQLFSDYGWEYLQDMNDYSYFRKPCDLGEMDTEIFSDDKSRLEMLSRIFRWRMLPLLIVFFLCILPNVWNHAADFSPSEPISIFCEILFVLIFALYLFLFIHMGIGFWRLNKKYNHKDS